MGLAASQVRYLSLTARKSDLEYQSQMINNARIQLANESADATRAYSIGMSNQIIRISHNAPTTDGKTATVWEELTYANLKQYGYRVIGTDGATLDPNPYTDYTVGTRIDAKTFNSLPSEYKGAEYATVDMDGYYTIQKPFHIATPNYNGMDIQALLVSGTGHIVTEAFYNHLVQHGYGTGAFVDDDGNPTTYEKLVEQFENDTTNTYRKTVVDWRSDETSTFKQTLYTEDDEKVQAEYEAKTAEIQAQDKRLECEVKKLETEHKAIETEMESLKKVIEKNIEQTYKTFA
ncbi:MAG: hypothetical protein MJ180_02365 [Candidatus Gastranaerophilales bacterium]|nr:hypothetical protein [Candidatus Gastranaerophilales bacterium]